MREDARITLLGKDRHGDRSLGVWGISDCRPRHCYNYRDRHATTLALFLDAQERDKGIARFGVF